MSNLKPQTSKFKFNIQKDIHKRIVLNENGEYEILLTGEGASVEIVGGWFLKGQEELKIKLTIIHRSPHTTANTLLKAVVSDRAWADIRGKIIVEKSAQQTESFLKEAVLLLSPEARATAIPDLEIEANEVHCSHAAAVSKIDEEQLYYLTSRGIARESAEEMIVEGFLKEVGI